MAADLGSPRLFRLARASAGPAESRPERCELCAEPMADEHRHLVDVTRARLLCACRACAVLFDHRAAGGRHYRLVPDRYRLLADVDLDDTLWAGLGIPVAMAFFVRETAADAVVARYPSPVGAARAAVEPEAWREAAARNPALQAMAADVEALLVNRARGAREHWIVPVDACYALVGLLRRRWTGFSGGREVWEEIDRFFGELRVKGEVTWQRAAASSERET